MKKRKFLWMLPYYPYPAVSGGNVRIFNLIKYLSRYYDIDLISYYDKTILETDISALEEYCRRVIVVERKQYEGELPHIFQYYTSPEMIGELESLLNEGYDFIQIDFLTMAYYIFMLKEKIRTPVFFTEHDVSSFYFEKCFHNRHLPEKERYDEWVRMQEVMGKIYPLFDAIFTVSYNDAVFLAQKIKNNRIFAAPTGTDCNFYGFKERRETCDLVYVGHFLHYPNVDSVGFFLEEIFPLIRKKYPDIKFNIVGSEGDRVFKDIAGDNIIVSGTVPDIRDYLYNSGIFVAPIRLGIGIRGKILEAMAAGVPVISTSLGASGIKAESGKHLMIADTPKEFLEKIDIILNCEAIRGELVTNARRFVEDEYDWPKTVEKIVDIYEGLLN